MVHAPTLVEAYAPGRVNLIGDHTDYNDGVALPMAVDVGTDVTFTATDAPTLVCASTQFPTLARVPVDIAFSRSAIQGLSPAWARMAAAVVAQIGPDSGGVVRITATVPVGAGLSSSASFCVALALALGGGGDPVVMARLCQRAEEMVGSAVGLMDPLVSMGGVQGHALLVDFATLSWQPVPVPEEAQVVVVHSGVARQVGRTPYAARRAECDAAALELGHPLGQADEAEVPGILDPVLRRRVRHVVTECRRTRAMAAALRDADLPAAGALMDESHRSLAEDFEATTPVVDELVAALRILPGVRGARMTGAGWGGCVVALTEPGALQQAARFAPWGPRARIVVPSAGAHLR